MRTQAWIRSGSFDLLWFILPSVVPLLLFLFFPHLANYNNGNLNVAGWVVLILLVDVSHVYSTLFRTYFSETGLKKYSIQLKVIPIVCLVIGVLLYSLNPQLFWRCLAYVAVFHFIKQQYGFVRIYSRKDDLNKTYSHIINYSVYLVTLIPVLIWHFQGQKNFNWFVEGDFFYYKLLWMVTLLKIILVCVIAVYISTEIRIAFKNRSVNLPRLLLISATAASWYVGIVVFNADIVFTALNVIAHGIPYMALIWATEKKSENKSGVNKFVFSQYGIFLFLLIIFAFAYFEEGIWDSLVWHENEKLFAPFSFASFNLSEKALCFIVPLLTLPQFVHYILDGFIWKGMKHL
jgi:hypothetical protein